MTDYRQGQAPYGGDVRPAGDVLLLHEEFESGGPGGPPFGPRGTPAAPLQARWLPWNPGVPAEEINRFIDPIAQRFALVGPLPLPDEVAHARWVGNVLRMPPRSAYMERVETGGDGSFLDIGYLTVMAGVGIGPGQIVLDAYANERRQAWAALVVSSEDLSVGDPGFMALGIKQESNPGLVDVPGVPAGTQWQGRAFFGEWPSASSPGDDLSFVTGSMGALFRLELVTLFEHDPPDPDVAKTQLAAFVSNDNGRSWTQVGFTEFLEGTGDVVLPASIGFGVSGLNDPSQQVPIVGTNPTGGFDFLRVYRRPLVGLEGLNLLLNPDGGRNWP